ncbi:hypothetical protein GGX14DRAFT_696323 [Mycena pura]|uniref:F-box domain-containing protein n=1 Tax=Mycena pura TaxID=153505 RepID=A0AAD6YIN6_9AGAR|nr:hypothetical protein GGX14DRAFT_696323 [Mycena pura]
MVKHDPLLDIPTELLLNILSFLDVDALYTCQHTSRFLRDLIASSSELQYIIQCGIAQVVDNPAAPIAATDRLALLRARERHFADVNASWKCTIPVTFRPAGLYELSGGLFWLGEHSRQALRFVELPLEPLADGAPPPRWARLPLPNPSKSLIIDFGLAIEEHDLAVMATFTWNTPTPSHNGVVGLEFLSVSTQQRHPRAKGPFEVRQSSWGLPHIILEIVGDNLIFIVGFNFGPDQPEDHVYVYEWRTGVQKMKITAPWHTYFGAVFLTTDTFMLPNTHESTLELWTIAPGRTAPTVTLQLVRLPPNVYLRHITARGEPNPTVYPRRKDPRVAFSPSAPDSIIVFHLSFFPGPNRQFLLFIHRRALIALLRTHEAETVPYAAWAPDVCRWVNATGVVMDWITTTSGQRCVLLPVRRPAPLITLDFNAHKDRARSSRRGPPPKKKVDWLDPADDVLMGLNLATEPVASRLPCVFEVSAELFSSYMGASMDDARIIALKKDLARQVQAVDVLYFG